MNPQAFCGVLSLALLLLAVVVKLWGIELRGAAAGGVAHGQAQAAAERRRFGDVVRETWHGNSGGRGLSGHVRRLVETARGMRGPRSGASAGSTVSPGSGPVSRIVRAAVNGARSGAGRARRAAAARTRRREAGGGSSRPGATSGPGRSRRPRLGTLRRPSGDRRRPAKLGVCDECSRTVNRASLKPVPVDRPGGTQQWKLCVLCRRKREGQPATSGSRPHGAGESPQVPQLRPEALPAARAAGGLQGTTTGPVDPGPAGPAAPQAQGGGSAQPTRTAAVNAGSPADAIPLDHAGSVPAMAGALPASTTSAAITGAAQPTGSTSGGTQIMSTGRTPLPAGGRYGTAVALPAGGTAVAVPGQTRDVVRQESTTHGGWTANVGQIIEALRRIHLYQDAMVGNLTAVDASRTQIEDVSTWSDHVTTVSRQIRDGLGAINERLRPYLQAIERNGGPEEVGSRDYHADY